MHRFCAIVLLSLMAFWLDAPALATTTQVAVPACCRMHGKHHCMMHMPDHGPSITEKCPFPPSFGLTVVNGAGSSLPAVAQSWRGALASQPAVQAQAEALLRISFARSRQKRGPPTLL